MTPARTPPPQIPPIAQDPDSRRRQARLRELVFATGCREFAKRREGMLHAMDGGLWLHRHVWLGEPLVHLVSTDRARLEDFGDACGLKRSRLQYKPLKDPRTGVRREAWHWDLGGPVYPPFDERIVAPLAALATGEASSSQPTAPTHRLPDE